MQNVPVSGMTGFLHPVCAHWQPRAMWCTQESSQEPVVTKDSPQIHPLQHRLLLQSWFGDSLAIQHSPEEQFMDQHLLCPHAVPAAPCDGADGREITAANDPRCCT